MSSRVPPDIQASPAVIEMFEIYGPAYTWFAVGTAMLGSFATLLTATIINVAIPEVMGAFGIGQDKAQWLSTAFLAAGTVTMLLAAWSTAVFGMRLTFTVSMAVFLVGSILGGLAPNPEVLIFSRLVQGAAAGVMSPLSMVINYQIFPAHRRGMAMGIFGIGVVLAPALGPTLGGILIDNYDWRYVFYLAIPFSMVSIPLAMMFMPARDKNAPTPAFDWGGVILLSVFLVSLLTGLSDGEREGWTSDYIVMLLASAWFSCIAFIWWELRTTHPLLNLRLFTHPKFLAASIVTASMGVGLYGSTYLVPLFLQTLQHISPTSSGFLMLPAGLAMAALFPVAGALSDRFEPRFIIMLGLILFLISSWVMRVVDVNTPYAWMVGWALIGRIGLAFIFPSLNAASLSALPMELLSQASGAINFLRQLGGAFGVNLLSIFLAQRTAEYSHAFTATQSSRPATLQMLQSLQDGMFGEHLGFLMQFEMTWGFLSGMVYSQAMTMSFREGFMVISVIFLLSLIPTWYMKKN
ncbi:MAG: DHA2 family efflux MFS transporter permease subunit [Pseudomonadales bacterium]|nr:DHA2 family efflux MFS transporter permease subunit [Pseudomonadales bacterium]